MTYLACPYCHRPIDMSLRRQINAKYPCPNCRKVFYYNGQALFALNKEKQGTVPPDQASDPAGSGAKRPRVPVGEGFKFIFKCMLFVGAAYVLFNLLLAR